MRIFKSLFKLLVVVFLFLALVFTALKYFPQIKNEPWNPMKDKEVYQTVDNEGYEIPVNGRKYVQQENDMFRNVPKSQMRNVFNWVDKYEFMQVNDMSRLGYDQEYLIAERDSQFILYRFGEKNMRIYTTEHDLYDDLNQIGHPISLQPLEAYQQDEAD